MNAIKRAAEAARTARRCHLQSIGLVTASSATVARVKLRVLKTKATIRAFHLTPAYRQVRAINSNR